MSQCPSCGGTIGRDCFNPIECAQITANINREGYNTDNEPQLSYAGFNHISKIGPSEYSEPDETDFTCKEEYEHFKIKKSEPSTIPVVDYEKEVTDLTNTIYFVFFPNGMYAREPIIKSIKAAITRARQMSCPSDTNSKVKELIELIDWNIANKSNDWNTSPYDQGMKSAFLHIKEKANSLIQQK